MPVPPSVPFSEDPWAECRLRPILIAGLGNLLLSDDGIGVHAIRELERDPPPGTLPVDIGTSILAATHLLERARKIIVVDAMLGGGRPGDVYTCSYRDIAGETAPLSLHQLSLASAYRLLPGVPLPEMLVVGVEPGSLEYGMELTPAGTAALPQVIRCVREQARDWMAVREEWDR